MQFSVLQTLVANASMRFFKQEKIHVPSQWAFGGFSNWICPNMLTKSKFGGSSMPYQIGGESSGTYFYRLHKIQWSLKRGNSWKLKQLVFQRNLQASDRGYFNLRLLPRYKIHKVVDQVLIYPSYPKFISSPMINNFHAGFYPVPWMHQVRKAVSPSEIENQYHLLISIRTTKPATWILCGARPK